MMKAYYFAGVLRYIKDPAKILTSKTYQSFAKIVMSPNLASAGNFLLSRNLMISAMHFQDAYNFDLDRVKSCLVHYGVIDPDDPSKTLEVPFCAMNTLHRERLEEANVKSELEAKKPEIIQKEIETYLENMDK